MKQNFFVKRVLGYLALYVAALLFCRYTRGYGVILIIGAGVCSGLTGKVGWAALCFIFLQSLVVLNMSITGVNLLLFALAKIGVLVVAFSLLFYGNKDARTQGPPLRGLFVYLVVGLISSMSGWCPVISYFKLANFSLFLLGISIVMRNVGSRPEALDQIRSGLMALSVFFIVGSLLSYPFPTIGYSMEISNAMTWDKGLYSEEYAADVLMQSGKSLLFSGLLNHSQTLAAVGVACFAWCLLDMVIIAERFDFMHILVLASALPMLFMTKSRTALLGIVVVALMLVFYVFPRVSLPLKIKRSLRGAMFSSMVLVAILAIGMEVSSGAMTRWFRKVDIDERVSAAEALTNSRMGLIDKNMDDFALNPVLGKGFQTIEQHEALLKSGRITWYSAPIEKGVIPTMILGETGVVGFVVFLLFLMDFFVRCNRYGYVATVSLFVSLLMLNMSEASFFSPGGQGGAEWMLLVVGGYALDCLNQIKQKSYFEYSIPFSHPYGV